MELESRIQVVCTALESRIQVVCMALEFRIQVVCMALELRIQVVCMALEFRMEMGPGSPVRGCILQRLPRRRRLPRRVRTSFSGSCVVEAKIFRNMLRTVD